jgi:hypothetical protein
MAEPQVLSPKEWDNAMLNGKNLVTSDQAMLYNLVRIRRGVWFFVWLTVAWITLSAITIFLIAVLSAGSN